MVYYFPILVHFLSLADYFTLNKKKYFKIIYILYLRSFLLLFIINIYHFKAKSYSSGLTCDLRKADFVHLKHKGKVIGTK